MISTSSRCLLRCEVFVLYTSTRVLAYVRICFQQDLKCQFFPPQQIHVVTPCRRLGFVGACTAFLDFAGGKAATELSEQLADRNAAGNAAAERARAANGVYPNTPSLPQSLLDPEGFSSSELLVVPSAPQSDATSNDLFEAHEQIVSGWSSRLEEDTTFLA